VFLQGVEVKIQVEQTLKAIDPGFHSIKLRLECNDRVADILRLFRQVGSGFFDQLQQDRLHTRHFQHIFDRGVHGTGFLLL
jgi:hypothetical protein